MKNPVELFQEAETLCRLNGFGDEIDWCDRRISFDAIDEQRFLHEYAWVVFNSGMKNKVIRDKWRQLSAVFLYFDPRLVADNSEAVRLAALTVFGNRKKIDAIITVARKICEQTYRSIASKIEENSIEYLKTLPFIGDVTKYHLARNLGFDYVKPDRHLVRLAKKYDMTPFQLCNLIHKKTKRRLGTIDVILWRYCEQQGQTKLAVNRS
jgi:endonuclease III